MPFASPGDDISATFPLHLGVDGLRCAAIASICHPEGLRMNGKDFAPTWPPTPSCQTHFAGHGRYPIPAYSEFMPPPRVAVNPFSGAIDGTLVDAGGDRVWRVPEVQELCELRPGLEHAAETVKEAISAAIQGKPWKGLTKTELESNPYWPGQPISEPGELAMLLPLALSRTQDDKGRVRWTLFGASHLGPDKAFWGSFFNPDGSERPAAEGIGFLKVFAGLAGAGRTPIEGSLHEAGFRLLPTGPDGWPETGLPSWAGELALGSHELERDRVKTLLTFRAFSTLPEDVREAARSGRIRLLPSPETLAVWSRSISGKLELGLPHATQIPLLLLFRRHEGPGMRIPQSGILHEGRRGDEPDAIAAGQGTYRRSSRQDKHARHLDILQFEGREAKLSKALFSSAPEDTGLYDKPLARNCQLWNSAFMPVLDGPSASPGEILCARSAVLKGGSFGYRFLFPAMRAGDYEVFWHRPLAAVASKAFDNTKVIIEEAPKGMVVAETRQERITLRPEIQARPERVAAAKMLLSPSSKPYKTEAAMASLRIFEATEALGPLPESAAAKITGLPGESIAPLLDFLAKNTEEPELAGTVKTALQESLAKTPPPLPEAITLHRTARREFELAYWSCIRQLSSGDFQNKNNADCVSDGPSQLARKGEGRGLDPLGDLLLERHNQNIKKSGVPGAFAGEIPFIWEGVYNFDWQGGWHDNRLGRKVERDLITVIPGKDRTKAVILADHYDTAFMEDVFASESGARIAAAGADDNLSATATLLLGAPIFLELAKEGKLGCDIWLVHLTGEEFPADCMGARRLAQLLVERRLAAMLDDGSRINLSKTEIQALFVMDMIAHNNEHEPDIFQIAPGSWPAALKAAMHAHTANRIWNNLVPELNAMEKRSELPRAKRSKGDETPAAGPFIKLDGQIRLHNSRRSSLYNTDGQVFSDAGLPAVLIMENYDINRKGYHDTHDTMENIDLDFGAALAAVCIEAAAQAAGNPTAV